MEIAGDEGKNDSDILAMKYHRFHRYITCLGLNYDELKSNEVDINSLRFSAHHFPKVGMECGDLLFLGFFGANSTTEGCRNLAEVYRQALGPEQRIARSYCKSHGLIYNGIDASANPGLGLPDSVGAGLESLMSAALGVGLIKANDPSSSNE